MKKSLAILGLTWSLFISSNEATTLDQITVEELTSIVRVIIQESLEKCKVVGTMEGRAKVNLAVIGSVEAEMYCDFEELPQSSE